MERKEEENVEVVEKFEAEDHNQHSAVINMTDIPSDAG